MGNADGIALLTQKRRKRLADGNAAVCAARTANGNRQAVLALLLIVWNQERQQALHFRHELLRHGVTQHEVAHIRIQPGMPPQPRNVERVWQEAHIKHKIRLHGQPAFIAEGVHLNVHGVRLTVAA